MTILDQCRNNPGAPNLDDCAPSDLDEFVRNHEDDIYKIVFPKRPINQAKRETFNLLLYADYKRMAMRLRIDGKIADAIRIENICADIYNKLPKWARW
jgi:hypothetical protein